MNEAKVEELKERTAQPMGGSAKTNIKDMMQGMEEKEMQIAVRNIPSNVLWDELRKRFDAKSEMVRKVRAAVMVTVDDVDERG